MPGRRLFYDESQRVNLLDYVSPEAIRNAMEKRGLDQSLLRERRLTWQHRCRDGDRFLAAVDRLLDHPELGLEGLGTFCENGPYQVALVDDPSALFQLIKRKRTPRRSRAVPAGCWPARAGATAATGPGTRTTQPIGPGDHCPSPGLGQGAVHLEFWKLRDREALCHRP